MTDRKVEIKVENKGDLFCNIILTKEMNKEDMKKKKAKGSISITGLSRQEAEDVYNKLVKVLF